MTRSLDHVIGFAFLPPSLLPLRSGRLELWTPIYSASQIVLARHANCPLISCDADCDVTRQRCPVRPIRMEGYD